MRILKTIIDDKVVGYTLWLSARDTAFWSAFESWPCSKISGHRIRVDVPGSNGLSCFTMDGKFCNVPTNELEAIVTDHLPDDCKHLWPV